MSAKRVGMYRLQELVRLHRQACGQRRIARLLKMGRNTIRAYLEALKKAGLLEGDPGQLPSRKALKEAVAEFAPAQPAPQQVSTVEYWADEIREMLLLGAGPKATRSSQRPKAPRQNYEVGSGSTFSAVWCRGYSAARTRSHGNVELIRQSTVSVLPSSRTKEADSVPWRQDKALEAGTAPCTAHFLCW